MLTKLDKWFSSDESRDLPNDDYCSPDYWILTYEDTDEEMGMDENILKDSTAVESMIEVVECQENSTAVETEIRGIPLSPAETPVTIQNFFGPPK